MKRARAAAGVLVWSLILFFLASSSQAQQSNADVSPITIVRKPGHEDGQAQMVVNGKVRKISPHAVGAFVVRGGDGALVIGLQPAKGAVPKQYVLRYYDLDSGRRRVLGIVPMSSATLKETEAVGGAWAFALSGTDLKTSRPADCGGRRSGDSGAAAGCELAGVSWRCAELYGRAARRARRSLGCCWARAKGEIYEPPQGDADGAEAAAGVSKWYGDGDDCGRRGAQGDVADRSAGVAVAGGEGTAVYSVPWAELEKVTGVPAGKRFGVRLMQELSSRTTHEGDVVKAVSITPVVVNGEILIPAGSILRARLCRRTAPGGGSSTRRRR